MLNFIDNILKENLVLKNALEDAKHQIEELRFQCEQLRRHQYGSRSERHVYRISESYNVGADKRELPSV